MNLQHVHGLFETLEWRYMVFDSIDANEKASPERLQ